jgi:hypothetical protein
MPFGQMRTEFVEGAGAMVEGKVVEGTVVEGTVVDGTAVVDGNGVVEGEMPGVCPTALLPELALSPRPGAGPTALPNWLGGVPVMLGVGVPTAPGVVPAAPGVVAAAPGAAAPAPPAAPPTWESAGNAARLAASTSGKRRESSMGNLLCSQAEWENSRKLRSEVARHLCAQALENPRAACIYFFVAR